MNSIRNSNYIDLNVSYLSNVALEKYQASNPSVEFNNVLHTPNQPNHLDPILREGEFPHKNFEMRHDWMKKKGS